MAALGSPLFFMATFLSAPSLLLSILISFLSAPSLRLRHLPTVVTASASLPLLLSFISYTSPAIPYSYNKVKWMVAHSAIVIPAVSYSYNKV